MFAEHQRSQDEKIEYFPLRILYWLQVSEHKLDWFEPKGGFIGNENLTRGTAPGKTLGIILPTSFQLSLMLALV